MKYRRLGTTGIKVSEISLGSWLTYGGYVENENAVKSIHKAYELGINFFDTANVYRRGEAEKVVGQALKAFQRESYVLATKVFFPMGDGVNDHGLSRKHIMEQANASLKRIGVDYVDIYYSHRYDAETPLEETLRAFDDLVRQGKILYIGVSEWTPAQIAEAIHIADKRLLDHLVVNQPVYNMFNRYIENEIIPLSEKHGIGQVVFSPLAQGMLTGKYKKDEPAPKGSRASDPNSKVFLERFMKEDYYNKVDKLQQIAKEMDITVAQLALAWVLRLDNISSALIGASRPEQVEENVKAVDIILAPDVLERIEKILSK